MKTTLIIAALAGVAAGYLAANKLAGYPVLSTLYAKGASFAA
jgi:hypothetical protein